MINTIVFDLGGVLIDWNPRYFYRDIFSSENEMEWFLLNVCNDAWNLEQDRGRSFNQGIETLKKSFPEQSSHIDLFFRHWQEMLKGEIDGTVEILKQLKNTYKIYGLTNWSAETFPLILARFDFLNLFDAIVVSGEERMIKPDKQFFRVLLDRYDLRSENCVFIDDNDKNITAASELGFLAIHFQDPKQLELDLKSIGIMKA